MQEKNKLVTSCIKGLVITSILFGFFITQVQAIPFTYQITSITPTTGAIPDAGCPGSGVTVTFNVTDNFTVNDVNLGVNITHTYRSDLDVQLTSPATPATTIYANLGGSADNLNVLFDSAAPNPVPAGNHAIAPEYVNLSQPDPVTALNAFNGGNSVGTWTLFVCDSVGADTGTLNNAELRLDGTPVVVATEINGVLYKELNNDGVRDFNEIGVPGATVTAYDSTGAIAGTATTGATGAYSITGLIDGVEYRIEFTNIPFDYQPAITGANSMTSVVFVTSPTSTVFYGVGSATQFCQSDPTLVTNLFRPLGQTTNGALLSFPYSSTGTTAAGVESNYSQIGSTWGLAYQSESNNLFASTYLKRHVQFGPGGAGAGDVTGSIYIVDNPTDAVLSTVSEFLNLNDIVGTNVTGTNTHPLTSDLTVDLASYTQAGKVSFGDMDISSDSKDLWVVNLFNRNLYRLPLGSNPVIPVAPTLAQISTVDMLNTANYVAGSAPACTGGNANNFRPFAVKFYQNKVFVGAVCSAESGGVGLDAHVYALDTTTLLFTEVVTFALNFNRGCGLAQGATCLGGAGVNSANWNPWVSTYPPAGMVSIGSERAYPQPMLSDIEFTNDEELIMGFRDRWGDQMGHNQQAPDGSGLILGEGYGDIVRATPNTGGTTWSFSVVEATDGTEYFNADSWTDGTYTHFETGYGGLVSIPAFSTVTMTNMDPINLGGGQSDFAGGIRSYKTTPGAVDHSYQLYTDTTGGNNGTTYFGKSNGLGDLEALCATPSLEIGNRIWNDSNANGVQDAGEPGISGLNVQLIDIDGVTVLSTVVTDANGQFYFTNATGTNFLGKNFGVAFLSNISNYLFRVDMTQVALTNMQITARGGTSGSFATSDIHDSDALLSGTIAEITVATGYSGQSNHSYDFGFFLPNATIGNRVWLDLDGDGIQDANEDGIANRIIQLTPPAGVDVGAGAGVAITTVTDTSGNYIFPDLPLANGYVVTVTNPPTGLTQTYDEDGIGTGSANTTTVNLTVANEEHLTADFGYAPPSGSIGDYVWTDVNGDGVQDPGEVGIAGVTVYLCTAANSSPCNAASTGVVTTTTDATGRYLFTGVSLTQISVVEIDTTTLPAGYVLTGDPDTVADNETTIPALNTSSNTNLDADFGYQPTIAANNSNIGDTIYLDLNGNGTQDTGETGISGVTVQLYIDTTANGIPDTPIGSVFTDSAGLYLFPSLLNGVAYGVYVTDTNNILNGLTQTGDPDATLDNQSTVASLSADNLLQDFGYVSVKNGTGIIGDKIFLDANGNNLQDALDQGLEGVKVSLFNNADGLIDSVVITDENGQYLFTGLDPLATYTVVVDTTTLPNGGAGWNNNIDPDGTTDAQTIVDLSLVAGGIDLTQDFGFIAATSNVISGTVWTDDDGNGLLTDGTSSTTDETANGINLVTIVLTDSLGNIVATTSTNSTGDYSFTGLPNGSYTVAVTDTNNVLANLLHTNGPSANNNVIDNNSQNDTGYVVTVTGGVTNTTADFGYKPVTTTPITLGSFETLYDGKTGLTTINWSTVTESGNIGFELYTRVAGKWLKVNDKLIASKRIYYVGKTEYQYIYDGGYSKEWAIVDINIRGKRQTHGVYELNRLYGENRQKNKSTQWNDINKIHAQRKAERNINKAKDINNYINKMKKKFKNDGDAS